MIEYYCCCCCWKGRRRVGGRSPLSIAAGRGDVGRAFRFEYCQCCCWRRDVGRVGDSCWVLLVLEGETLCGRSALSTAVAVSSGWPYYICYCLISQSQFPWVLIVSWLRLKLLRASICLSIKRVPGGSPGGVQLHWRPPWLASVGWLKQVYTTGKHRIKICATLYVCVFGFVVAVGLNCFRRIKILVS